MWRLADPWYDCCIRAACIYFFLLVVLRITGKRQVGQLAPFDLILLLVLSNAVQNAMIGNDTSIPGGCITAATLIALNYFVGFCTYRSKWLEGLVEGRPIRLVHNGHIEEKNLHKVRMTIHELNAALRAEGHGCVDEVQVAILENTGRISVVGKKNGGGLNH
ncbi:MAG TPA: YetF domain-containing protein [Tepidisphaeraceae bacterium]|jgi:uncharacterized membrane protein YcaP (DUF421 family)|nr:YetF domain-containing protein [Tepidisphaeraceae bacterium]